MIGMKSFYIKNITNLSFTTNIGINTTITTNSTYNYLSFMYWSFKYRVCPNGYNYFIVSNQLCYDICPIGTVTDINQNICIFCNTLSNCS